MTLKKQTVKHSYTMIKHWTGVTHFLVKSPPNVQTEISLHVLAYNFKRVINSVGVQGLIAELKVA